MNTSRMRGLCPYLAKNANLPEATRAMCSLPEALKLCPYVKELYSGFEMTESDENIETQPLSCHVKTAFKDSKMKPKLFRMEEQISICPCRDRFGVSDITHIDTCDQKQNAYQNQKFTKSGDAPAEISLYDDK